jgi:hypothetical protein
VIQSSTESIPSLPAILGRESTLVRDFHSGDFLDYRTGFDSNVGAFSGAIDEELVRRALIRVAEIDLVLPKPVADLRTARKLPIDVRVGAYETVNASVNATSSPRVSQNTPTTRRSKR